MTELYFTKSIDVGKTNLFTTCFSLLEMTGLQIGLCLGASLGLTVGKIATISVKGKACGKGGIKTASKQLGAPYMFNYFGFTVNL